MSTLWQDLLKQVDTNPSQTVPEPQLSPINLIQPMTNQQVLGNLLVDNPIPNVEQELNVINQAINSTVVVDDDDDDIIDEDDFEVGVDDAPIANTFSLTGLNIGSDVAKGNPAKNNNVVTDIFNFGKVVTQQPNPIINTEVEVQQKRGRGRPPKNTTASQMITELNTIVNEQSLEQSKSIESNSQVSSQLGSTPKEITFSLSKKTFREIGETLQKLANACFELSKGS